MSMSSRVMSSSVGRSSVGRKAGRQAGRSSKYKQSVSQSVMSCQVSQSCTVMPFHACQGQIKQAGASQSRIYGQGCLTMVQDERTTDDRTDGSNDRCIEG